MPGWEVIEKLALLCVFIEQTDHLSDRELYIHLWTDSLREETKALPLTATSAYHIQMLGSGSEEDNLLYLKYYADDASCQHWQEEFPNDPIPRHEDHPTIATACCPSRLTVRPLAENPTEAFADTLVSKLGARAGCNYTFTCDKKALGFRVSNFLDRKATAVLKACGSAAKKSQVFS